MKSARCLSLATGIIASLLAQNAEHKDESATIRVQTELVLINASVTDHEGKVVTGMDASQFDLFEDGRQQVIKYCVSEDTPVSIGLVLDTSSSMSEDLALLKKAAVQFVRAANLADEFLLVGFGDRPEVVVPFTSDTDRLLLALGRLESHGSTALLDAVHLAVNEMRLASLPRKALILISDGLDNHSRYSERETRRLLEEVNFPIYTIRIHRASSGNRYAIQRRDIDILEMISMSTGGRHFQLLDSKKLVSVAKSVNAEIRHEYLLGYVPSNRQTDGKLRRVRVKIDPSAGQGLKISYRAGYFAPP